MTGTRAGVDSGTLTPGFAIRTSRSCLLLSSLVGFLALCRLPVELQWDNVLTSVLSPGFCSLHGANSKTFHLVLSAYNTFRSAQVRNTGFRLYHACLRLDCRFSRPRFRSMPNYSCSTIQSTQPCHTSRLHWNRTVARLLW